MEFFIFMLDCFIQFSHYFHYNYSFSIIVFFYCSSFVDFSALEFLELFRYSFNFYIFFNKFVQILTSTLAASIYQILIFNDSHYLLYSYYDDFLYLFPDSGYFGII